MIESMIERVAKALSDLWYDSSGTASEKEQARAAIEAMREPTEEMIFSGGKTPYYGRDTPRIFWHVMIDAALSEDGAAENQK